MNSKQSSQNKPRYTLTLTDNKLGKYMAIGAEELKQFRDKGITGKSHIYALLERFEEEVARKNSK